MLASTIKDSISWTRALNSCACCDEVEEKRQEIDEVRGGGKAAGGQDLTCFHGAGGEVRKKREMGR